MIATNIYLHFDGNCRNAMTFYGECLQAAVDFTPFSTTSDRILHAEMTAGPLVLMGSDVADGVVFHQGNNFSISLSCASLAEMETLFAAIGEGGQVTMPMHLAFWGGHMGMLTDRFGIAWMLSFR